METINIITFTNMLILIWLILSLLFWRKIILYKSIIDDMLSTHINGSKTVIYHVLTFFGFLFDIFLIIIIVMKIFDVVISSDLEYISFILIGLFLRTSSLFYYIGYKKINTQVSKNNRT